MHVTELEFKKGKNAYMQCAYIYVRLLSGNWKLEVKSEETLQSFHPAYQKAEDVNFFKVFLIISLKGVIRVKLQRCSANMNIKGRSRIRNSRIYSNRGQTVWSSHPQFGEDFKNNYLQKKQFLPKSILMLCKFETMHSS